MAERDESGQFTKGNSGRPKGSKNKLTTNIRELVMTALNDERIGGEEGFIKWIDSSKRNKELFYSWLMKMLPTNLDVSSSEGFKITIDPKYLPKSKGKDRDESTQDTA